MATLPHESRLDRRSESRWIEVIKVPEIWAGVGIITMWLAVLVAAVWGPDLVSINGGGTQSTTTIPSAIGVALFAFLGTSSLAKYVFRRDKR